ncbi:hypothetical protein PPERSA_10634 [Pseudocohnilembus persalinus]|uniref:Transmembrane protein n=1 Tax=Pseudocohnilembus persalinus TaxID=266149 RepID=A0A0V0QD44_PSEPJ|nr:hypothetical protein PPERSA_10634 [Pseudocohnilembus persalinus]|eukprot:KRX00135.1 hypothetical protein PPERSA_10634 [Pseudocohnilembus persalinus]
MLQTIPGLGSLVDQGGQTVESLLEFFDSDYPGLSSILGPNYTIEWKLIVEGEYLHSTAYILFFVWFFFILTVVATVARWKILKVSVCEYNLEKPEVFLVGENAEVIIPSAYRENTKKQQHVIDDEENKDEGQQNQEEEEDEGEEENSQEEENDEPEGENDEEEEEEEDEGEEQENNEDNDKENQQKAKNDESEDNEENEDDEENKQKKEKQNENGDQDEDEQVKQDDINLEIDQNKKKNLKKKKSNHGQPQKIKKQSKKKSSQQKPNEININIKNKNDPKQDLEKNKQQQKPEDINNKEQNKAGEQEQSKLEKIMKILVQLTDEFTDKFLVNFTIVIYLIINFGSYAWTAVVVTFLILAFPAFNYFKLFEEKGKKYTHLVYHILLVMLYITYWAVNQNYNNLGSNGNDDATRWEYVSNQ